VAIPAPPANLAALKPRLHRLPAGASLHRFFRRRHGPIFFDRSNYSHGSRFNSPDGSFGVLYVSKSRRGAFAETFLRDQPSLLAVDQVAARAYVRFELQHDMTFVVLLGTGLGRLRVTAEVCSSSPPYDITHAWSEAIHGAFPDVSGIAYPARHDNEATSFAVFDRAADAFSEVEREDDIDQDWFWELAASYDVGATS
jgi:RES domain-containing protein